MCYITPTLLPTCLQAPCPIAVLTSQGSSLCSFKVFAACYCLVLASLT